MKTHHDITINTEACVGCGLCVRICPSNCLAMNNGKAVATGRTSIGCSHCAAICPVGAIHISGLDENALCFSTFKSDNTWIPFGDFDQGELVRLMRSRRSCRVFDARPVCEDTLEDLVKIGITAPSGTNSQQWTFTILPDRPAVARFGDEIGKFFRKLNAMAEKAWLRTLLKYVGKPDLAHYYQEYYHAVRGAIEAFDRDGTDMLFHGASAAILVGSAPGASCPMEDAMLATQNILLGAHAMGLGTCLIGYAVAAMDNDKKIQRAVSIPDEEKVYAVIALGYPDQTWKGLTGRKPPVIRYVAAGSVK